MRPTIGRIVHLVAGCGEHRAAIVTEVEQEPTKGEHVSLAVFSTHDTYHCRDVRHDESGLPNTWHWPEREP